MPKLKKKEQEALDMHIRQLEKIKVQGAESFVFVNDTIEGKYFILC